MVITVVAGAKEMLTPVFPPAAGDRKYLRRGECCSRALDFQRGVVSTVTNFLLDGDYKQRATLYADYIKDKCPWGARLALVFPDLVAINGSTNAELDSFSECIALFTASLGPVALRTVIIVPETVPQEHASSIGDLSRTLAERAFAGRSDLDVQLIAPSIDDERSEALYKKSVDQSARERHPDCSRAGTDFDDCRECDAVSATAVVRLHSRCFDPSHMAIKSKASQPTLLRSMILDSRRGGRVEQAK